MSSKWSYHQKVKDRRSKLEETTAAASYQSYGRSWYLRCPRGCECSHYCPVLYIVVDVISRYKVPEVTLVAVCAYYRNKRRSKWTTLYDVIISLDVLHANPRRCILRPWCFYRSSCSIPPTTSSMFHRYSLAMRINQIHCPYSFFRAYFIDSTCQHSSCRHLPKLNRRNLHFCSPKKLRR